MSGESESAYVMFRSVHKTYAGAPRPVLADFSLSISRGEFVTILGPSGSGKTTLLRCLAGLEDVSSGEILIDGATVNSRNHTVPAGRRNIGMVFQSYALWPHKSVYDNVAYALRIRGMPKGEIERRVAELLTLLDISAKRNAYPHELSGGQQQRVALARALAPEPRLLLLDEPLSNLDARLRDSTRKLLRRVAGSLNVTVICVSHDRLDAMAMADTVVLVNDGRLVQHGHPAELYRNPRDLFVAAYLGDLNVISGRLVSHTRSKAEVELFDGGVKISCRARPDVELSDTVAITMRLGDVLIDGSGPPDSVPLGRGTVEDVTFLGEVWRYRVQLMNAAGTSIESLSMHSLAVDVGNEVEVTIRPGAAVSLPSDSQRQLQPSPSDTGVLANDRR